MLLKISDLQLGKVRFSETFPPGAIEFFDAQLRQTGDVEVKGVAELHAATMEIQVSGSINAAMEVACDRCLETARFPISSDFNLLYRPAELVPERDESAIEGQETEIGFYEGEGLELADVLREQILLLLPMQRVCREDCKGICPICGQNRNQVACECHQEVTDDRWAGLKNL